MISKKGKKFEVRTRHHGKQIRRRFDSKREANDFVALLKDGLKPDIAHLKATHDMGGIAERERAPTYRTFLEKYFYPDLLTGEASQIDKPVSWGTRVRTEQRINNVLPIVGNVPLNELEFDHYREMKIFLKTNPMKCGKVREPTTSNRILKSVKQSLKHAVRIGLLKYSPWAEGTLIYVPPKEKPHWKLSEAESFLKTVREEREDHFIFFLLALQGGLRKSELFGLRKMDIDFEEGLLHVCRQWDQAAYDTPLPGEKRQVKFKHRLKNGKPSKSVPLTGGTLAILADYVKTLIRDDTPLYSFSVKQMKNTRIELIRPYAEKAGVPDHKMHATRDSFIGNMKRAGVSDFHIARIAGCTLENLKNYGHLDLADVKESIRAVDFRSIR